MPSTLLPRISREILAWKLWRNSGHLQLVRSRSTAQSIKTWEEDSGASAFLYGANIGPAAIAKNLPAQNPHVSPWKSPQQASRINVNREARRTPAAPSAPQQLSHDENFIQDQIDFPTPKDYPNLDPSIFMLPKGPIVSALQGRANFNREFTCLGLDPNKHESYQCTVTCVSRGSSASDTGIGHGRTKVCFAGRLMNSLTVPRDSPRGLPISICYISFTRMGPSWKSSPKKNRARIIAVLV